MNAQQSNHFLNYQNYHHDQLMHHQYFDENPHTQNYNFTPYASNDSYTASLPAPQQTEQMIHSDNFPTIQTNELYEFLPEEIFQLDQPILKSESQPFTNGQPASNMESLQMPFNSHNSDITNASHSFLDLSSGQIQTNTKYPTTTTDNFSSEINNNSNYHANVGVENVQMHQKASNINEYNYQINQEVTSRLTCAVESEKVLKRKYHEIDPIVKQNPPTHHQNYHLNHLTKRESSCLLQQTTNYYPPELYTSFPSKSNDVYRSMEKYNNYITNN